MGGSGGLFGGIKKGIGDIFGNTGGGEGGVQFDGGGQPVRPGYQSSMDPNNPDHLRSAFELNSGPDIQLDKSGIQGIQDRANAAPGTSAWGNLMRQQNSANQATSRSNTSQQADSGLAQAQSSLAQQRGLSSGASERLATNAMRDKMSQNQNIANQGNQQNLQIGTQEATNQMNAQNMLPGLQMGAANFEQGQRAFDQGTNQYNIGNALKENQNQNAQNLSAYQAQLGQWAAANQSNAMSQANNRGKK